MADMMLMNDKERLARWLADISSDSDFWASIPRWAPTTTTRGVDGELLVWTEAGVATFGGPGSAVASLFDGMATLDELALDLAVVAEAPLDRARTIVGLVAVELLALGALEGLDVDLPANDLAPTPDGDTSSRIDPATDEEVRIQHSVDDLGRPITIEHWPDGRRRMSMTIQLRYGAGDQDALAALATGDRSAAELVPTDSCLGSKLRDSDDLPLLTIRCADSKVRSVRCHDLSVLAGIEEAMGDRVVADGRGPIEVFVVDPLDGVGPPRVYDGLAQRRGRARSPEQVVDLVDRLLGEASSRSMAAASNVPVLVDLALVRHGSGVDALVPLAEVEQRGVAAKMDAAGWQVTFGRVQIEADGTVSAPTAGGGVPLSKAPTVIMEGVGEISTARRAGALLSEVSHMASVTDRDELLDRLVEMAAASRWVSPDGPLGDTLNQLVK